MHPEVAAKLNVLEDRRRTYVERVRKLSPQSQRNPVRQGGYTPIESVMHLALAEMGILAMVGHDYKTRLNGVSPKPSLVFEWIVKQNSSGRLIPISMGYQIPKKGVRLEDGDAKWAQVRAHIRSLFDDCSSENTSVLRKIPVGTLSAEDVIRLFAAHMSYHERQLPRH